MCYPLRPWTTIASVSTDEGELQLRQRGEREFLIVSAGRVLMTSSERVSEQALATLACAPIAARAAPRVLIGGLGMAYTLRAALDALPATAAVMVAELNPAVVAWCRGPLAALADDAVFDPRVKVEIADVAAAIASAWRVSYDAILIDLYEGPHAATQRADDPFYGTSALGRCRDALAPGGMFAVWSEEPDAAFARRFAAAGFQTRAHRLGKSRRHVVYLGRCA